MEVSYVLAGYNEESIIEQSIRDCLIMLERDFDDYELILVNDASTDRTGDIMRSFCDNPHVRYLDNIVNMNFGTSVLRGLLTASKELVVYNAADLPFPLADTKRLCEEAERYDVLVIQRVGYKGVFWRRLTSAVNIGLLYLLFPIYMRGNPVLTYIQIFRRSIIETILPLARSPIFIWAEMIFRAKKNGLRVGNIKNTPHIEEIRRGAFGHPHDIIWGVYEMLRFRIRCWFGIH